jgi:microcystin-dependent protein
MSNKIEILENTLLKLLVRRGGDLDRQNITLDEGELGYTTDNKRLFVGDSSTSGGIVTGNKFLGTASDHSALSAGAEDGDIAFNTTSKALYTLWEGAWVKASQVLAAYDSSIVIDDVNGTIRVGTLSANNFDNDALGNSLELVAGRISLSGTQILTDRINVKNDTHLKLPEKLNINDVNYNFPVGAVANNQFLRTDSAGQLSWSAPLNTGQFYVNSSSAFIPVGTIMAAASGKAFPSGWLLCDGSSVSNTTYGVLSSIIGAQYGGSGNNFNLPNYEDVVHVGQADVESFSNGTLNSTGSTYTTKAVSYYIKALPDAVVTSTLTINGGLTASNNNAAVANGVPINTLAGAIKIGPVPPGIHTVTAAGTSTFVTVAEHTKVWVTGSGAKGGSRTGGAAATVYAILSTQPGATVNVTVGAGQSTAASDGNLSKIAIGGVDLVISDGAEYHQTSNVYPDGNVNSGTLLTSNPQIIGGYIIPGGRGGWRTNNNDEEIGATASFWGADNAPGAGAGSWDEQSIDTKPGLVKFEWGM